MEDFYQQKECGARTLKVAYFGQGYFLLGKGRQINQQINSAGQEILDFLD